MNKIILKSIGFCLIIIGLACFNLEKEKHNALKDAVAVWNMSDTKNVTGKGGMITTIGEAKLGITLKDRELEISSQHGSDGNVARLDGGYLIIGTDKLKLTGKEMTLCIRMQNHSDEWNMPILAKSDPNDEFGTLLYQKDGMLEYLWRTSPAKDRVSPDWFNSQKNLPAEFLNGILRIGVPIDMIGACGWQDVVVRFRETVIEMFVDGVLVDEEWPHGSLYHFQGPFLIGAAYEKGKIKTGFKGLIDHVVLWNRALTNEEITTLSGGADFVAKRDLEILGPEQSSLQYWHPRGYNTSAGDVMCLFNEGTFHVFWLYDRRHHGSKWIMGAHQYAHVSTRNLVNWQHHPLAVPLTHQWESAMGTGDHIVSDGIFYAFYTDCGSRVEFPEKPHKGAGIFMATSNDGIHYNKSEQPVMEGGDCSIFHDEETGLFHLIRNGTDIFVQQDKDSEKGQRGLINYTSSDMMNWTAQKGLLLNEGGACPHLFKWNTWYYLTVGGRFWRSRNAIGPWTPNLPAQISQLYFPKTAEYTGGRRLAGGWISDNGWGGDLVFFELVQNSDGSLGTKFVPEMIPASGDHVKLNFTTGYSFMGSHPHNADTGDSLRLAFTVPQNAITSNSNRIRIKAPDGFRAVMSDNIPRNVRITMVVKPTAGIKTFGLCMRGEGNYEKGCELQFDVIGKRIQYGEPQNGGPSTESKIALSEIEGLDKPFTLDIVVTGTIIDACIDNRHTIIRRYYPEKGDRLFFFARNGEVTFEDISVRPLVK